MNVSYWEKKSFFGFQDLMIVGSGIVGLSAAIHFKAKHPKSRVMIVDGGVIPQGSKYKKCWICLHWQCW
jgi:gamma-glutamylputrescine oxidase